MASGRVEPGKLNRNSRRAGPGLAGEGKKPVNNPIVIFAVRSRSASSICRRVFFLSESVSDLVRRTGPNQSAAVATGLVFYYYYYCYFER